MRKRVDASDFISCAKLTIAQVQQKRVQIKFALITIIAANTREIEFLSALRLPAADEVEYLFEMTIAGEPCRVSGRITGRTKWIGLYQYKASLDVTKESGSVYIQLLLRAYTMYHVTFAKAEQKYLDWMKEETPTNTINCLA